MAEVCALDFNSIFDNLLASAIAKVVGVLVTGGGLAWLRARKEKLAGPAIYAVIGIACASFVIFSWTGRSVLSQDTPETTAENIQTNVRQWADDVELGIRKLDDANYKWIVTITLRNGKFVDVGQPAKHSSYLLMRATINLTPDQMQAASSLDKTHADGLLRDILLELARAKVANTVHGPPLTGIEINKAIPITTALTEASFSNRWMT
jgi:hypothetical protein